MPIFTRFVRAFLNRWLQRRRRERDRRAPAFFFVAVALSALMLVAVMSAAVRREQDGVSGEDQRPDFARLVPAAADEPDRSIFRLPGRAAETYLVGYRTGSQSEVAAVRAGGLPFGARLISTAVLGRGERGVVPGFRALGFSDADLYLAYQGDGRGLVELYVLDVSSDRLRVVERLDHLSSVPPQMTVVGERGGARITARFGDLDGDGRRREMAVFQSAEGGATLVDAYRYDGTYLAYDSDISGALALAQELFGAEGGEEPAVVIEPLTEGDEPAIITVPNTSSSRVGEGVNP